MGILLALTAIAGVAAGANAQCMSLVDAATENGLTGILDLVTAVSELDAATPLLEVGIATEPIDNPVTLFVPTNEAFAEIADITGELDTEVVLAVLLNHVLLTVEDAAALTSTAPSSLTTLLGTTLDTSVVGADLIITPTGTTIAAKVITADVQTCAGIIHVVDKVLIPAGPGEVADKPAAAPGPVTTEVAPAPVEVVAVEPVVVDVIGAYGEEVDGVYGEESAGAY